MHIGVLLTGHVAGSLIPTYGDYDAMFESFLGGRGFTFSSYPVVDMVFPEGPSAADGWLITGSRHGVYEGHPWIAPLERLVRAAFIAGVPVVGICFGHQLVARSCGARVEKFRGGWAVGRQIYEFDGNVRLALNAWHQDQVVSVPDGAEVIARNPFCRIAALAYGDRALTIQAHPEFHEPYLKDLIAVRGRGTVPDRLLDDALDGLGQPVDSPALADRMAAFLIKSGQCHAGRNRKLI
ncbi:MAG: type 1 glutamine amidotransferase [Rhodobacter sp.]|nr:type 1 glutamine amidotransferase [Rhodobacter sp.]MCY4242427.1 type 1 glutamine amidotransferase [Rhodobacter sp.]